MNTTLTPNCLIKSRVIARSYNNPLVLRCHTTLKTTFEKWTSKYARIKLIYTRIFSHSYRTCQFYTGEVVFKKATAIDPCLFGHTPEYCKCDRPALVFDQDESIFYSNLVTTAYWKYHNSISMETKVKDMVVHVSGIQNEL